MKFKELSKSDRKRILKLYNSNTNRKEIQETLASYFDVTERTIRDWAKKLGVGLMKFNVNNPSKILIYDIETSRVRADVWWTGKQYVSYQQLKEEPKIITVAYKWLGSDETKYLTWDENHSDETLVREFASVYNKADMVIGQNNDKFDNRWFNARAMKFGISVNVFIRSFDIMKETKRLFRLPSYSMDYITTFLGVANKMQHEGIIMWDKIQNGTPEEQKEYLQKMVDYNVQDVIATEEMYLKLRKYMGHKMHFGVLQGGSKHHCPNCGSKNVSLRKTTVTPAGTIQRVMQCNVDNVQYKITNRQYMEYLKEDFIKNNN